MSYTNAAERIGLLEKAIQLSVSLASVLADVGPNSFGAIVSPSGDKTAYERIHQLEGDLHVKLQTVSEYRNVALSASTRLTDDILRAIFSVAVTSGQPNLYTPREVTSTAISAVCRRWRLLALDTATLWNSVFLTTPQQLNDLEPRRRHPVYDNFTTQVLNRRQVFCVQQSQGSLLDVDFALHNRPTLPHATSIFTTTCSIRTRLLNLHMRGTFDLSMAHAAVECINATKSSLVHLKIDSDSDPVHNVSPQVQSLFATAFDADMPCLAHVELYGVPSPDTWERCKAFANGKTLHFDIYNTTYASPNRIGDGISSWSNLCELNLFFIDYEPDLHLSQMERMLLPNLRRLQLQFRNCNTVTFPFYRLNVPRLAHLDISVVVGWGASNSTEEILAGIPSAVSDLLKSSGSPELQSLQTTNLSRSCLEPLLQMANTIKKFSLDLGQDGPYALHVRESTYAILSYLESNHNEGLPPSGLLCPSLDSLELGLIGSLASMKRLIQFVRIRKAAGMPLRAIKFKDWLRTWGMQNSEVQEMPSIAETLEAESELAGLVDELIVGQWRFDKEGGCWVWRE